MTDEWLSAEWLAEVATRHYEFEAKYCDDDGNIVLRERRCHHCDEDWPCDVGELLAQDGRWRALVGDLLAALPRDVVKNIYDLSVARQHVIAIYDEAQAALDGVPGEG